MSHFKIKFYLLLFFVSLSFYGQVFANTCADYLRSNAGQLKGSLKRTVKLLESAGLADSTQTSYDKRVEKFRERINENLVASRVEHWTISSREVASLLLKFNSDMDLSKSFSCESLLKSESPYKDLIRAVSIWVVSSSMQEVASSSNVKTRSKKEESVRPFVKSRSLNSGVVAPGKSAPFSKITRDDGENSQTKKEKESEGFQTKKEKDWSVSAAPKKSPGISKLSSLHSLQMAVFHPEHKGISLSPRKGVKSVGTANFNPNPKLLRMQSYQGTTVVSPKKILDTSPRDASSYPLHTESHLSESAASGDASPPVNRDSRGSKKPKNDCNSSKKSKTTPVSPRKKKDQIREKGHKGRKQTKTLNPQKRDLGSGSSQQTSPSTLSRIKGIFASSSNPSPSKPSSTSTYPRPRINPPTVVKAASKFIAFDLEEDFALPASSCLGRTLSLLSEPLLMTCAEHQVALDFFEGSVFVYQNEKGKNRVELKSSLGEWEIAVGMDVVGKAVSGIKFRHLRESNLEVFEKIDKEIDSLTQEELISLEILEPLSAQLESIKSDNSDSSVFIKEDLDAVQVLIEGHAQEVWLPQALKLARNLETNIQLLSEVHEAGSQAEAFREKLLLARANLEEMRVALHRHVSFILAKPEERVQKLTELLGTSEDQQIQLVQLRESLKDIQPALKGSEEIQLVQIEQEAIAVLKSAIHEEIELVNLKFENIQQNRLSKFEVIRTMLRLEAIKKAIGEIELKKGRSADLPSSVIQKAAAAVAEEMDQLERGMGPTANSKDVEKMLKTNTDKLDRIAADVLESAMNP
jgi:hypothetical protein